MEDLALFLHLLGVLAFAAGVVLAALAFEAARRRPVPTEVAALLGLARSGAMLVVLGGLLLFICGLWLVELEEVGFGTGWVIASITLFIAATALGALGGRRPRQARLLAERIAQEDGAEVGAELRALLDDPVSRAANYTSASLVPVILALMVFQP